MKLEIGGDAVALPLLFWWLGAPWPATLVLAAVLMLAPNLPTKTWRVWPRK